MILLTKGIDYNNDMKKYKLSFTFGGLLLPETRIIAREYWAVRDWNRVKKDVLDKNLLQKTRKASRYRYFREIRDRINNAYSWELNILANEKDESIYRLVNLVIVSRYYKFVRDFVIEVIRYKVIGNDLIIMDYDYPTFFERKVVEHPELLEISESTKSKIQQVVFRALKGFEETWGKKYPHIVKSWNKNWKELVVMFKYPPEIRRLIYTTNPIESFNRQLRKISKNKSVFPNEDAVLKLFYLAVENIHKRWKQRIRDWGIIYSQLAIMYEERIQRYL